MKTNALMNESSGHAGLGLTSAIQKRDGASDNPCLSPLGNLCPARCDEGSMIGITEMANCQKSYTSRQVTALCHSLGMPGGTAESIVAEKLTAMFGFVGGKRQVIKQYLEIKPEIVGVKPFVKKSGEFVYHGTAASALPHPDVSSVEFLSTYQWRKVRLIALTRDGSRCACCGATPATGAVMNVDHIKPRKRFPELALDPANLQVLCHECNHGKGNWDMTDFRQQESPKSRDA